LTHSSCNIHIARNFLRTIEPFIQNERARIALSDGMISTVLAYANEWIGWELFLNGDNGPAARHFLKSLSYKPLSPKLLVLLLLAIVPTTISRASLKTYRGLRTLIKRGGQQLATKE